MYTFAAKHGCLLASSSFDSIISAVFSISFSFFAAPTHCELLRKLQVSSQSVPRPCLPVVWREAAEGGGIVTVVGRGELGAFLLSFFFLSAAAQAAVLFVASLFLLCVWR